MELTKDLFQDTRFSDLTLICLGYRFDVHRVVVCRQSTWLDRACNAAHRVRSDILHTRLAGTDALKDDRTIFVRFCDPQTLARVIRYLYLHNYNLAVTELVPVEHSDSAASMTSNFWDLAELSDSPLTSTRSTRQSNFRASSEDESGLIDLDEGADHVHGTPLVTADKLLAAIKQDQQISHAWVHIKVFHAADTLGISHLRDISLAQLKSTIHNSWQSTGFVELVHHSFSLYRQSSEIPRFCSPISAECVDPIKNLIKLQAFSILLQSDPRLAFALIQELVNRTQSSETYICGGGGTATGATRTAGQRSGSTTSASTQTAYTGTTIRGFVTYPLSSEGSDASQVSVSRPPSDDIIRLNPQAEAFISSGLHSPPDSNGMSVSRKGRGSFLAEETDQLRVRIASLQDENSRLKTAIALRDSEADQELSALRTQCQRQIAQLLILQKTLNEQQRQMTAMQQEMAIESKQMQSASESAAVAGACMADADMTTPIETNLRAELIELEEVLEEERHIANQKIRFLKDNITVMKQHQEPRQHYAHPEELAQEMSKAIANKDGQVRLLHEKLDQLSKRLSDTQTQLEVSEKSRGELRTQCALLNAEFVSRNNAADRMQSEITRLRDQRNTMSTEKSRDSQRDQMQRRQIALLSQKVVEIHQEWQARLNKEVENHDRTKSALASLESRLESKSQYSQPTSTSHNTPLTGEAKEAGIDMAKASKQGPMTFFERMQASRANIVGQAAAAVLTAETSVKARHLPIRSADATKQKEKSDAPPAPVQQPSKTLFVAKQNIRPPPPSNVKTGPITVVENITPIEAIKPTRTRPVLPTGGPSSREHQLELANGELRQENAKLRKDITFFRQEMSTLRMSNVGAGQPRGLLMPNSSSSVQAYNEALRIAGQDFKACVGCGIPFYSQFRGAPENDKLRMLILKCTKCDEECCRWDV